ncbi:molybdenum ABC transporter ATP-binding protein [Marinicella rhabdoformis]|uniref:molybdenum ABC transporter ATP-binding protein n=1 Tax=Marinicella rhabdoformis TaxID=2580566 RepID=UPI0015CFA943|nr:molybdenum ABC transporter ATP-binding protein [Marinicella rhabdoformis]
MSLHVDIKQQLADFDLSLNATLPSEGITVVFGPSGCGKTTLLRCLSGLSRARNSNIIFKGRAWQSDKAFVKPQHRQVAMVFQHNNLLPHLNVTQNINYAIKRRKHAGLSFDELVEMFDLSGLLLRHNNQLSGGELQRVAMARALASAPALLLMDEPMSALDDDRKAELLSYLKKIKQITPIIYVTHSRREMMRLADYVVMIEQGRVVASGGFWKMMQTQHELMTGEQSVWSVLKGQVNNFDSKYHLCQVDAECGQMWVNAQSLNLGDNVRLLVNASDVAVSKSQPTDSSVLNVVSGNVANITPFNASQSQVNLTVNGVLLTALLTHKSIAYLGLKTGQHVYAQIKAVALVV